MSGAIEGFWGFTFSSFTASMDTVSAVMRTASFLVVPASRRECARTKAPATSYSQHRFSIFKV